MISIGYEHRRVVHWNLGDELPSFDDRWRVKWVMARGDEVDAIRSKFTGLPMCDGKSLSWFGDHAAFIANNLGALSTEKQPHQVEEAP